MRDPSDMAKTAADVFSQKVPSPKKGSEKTWEKIVEEAKKNPLKRSAKALSKAASSETRGKVASALQGQDLDAWMRKMAVSVPDLWRGLSPATKGGVIGGAAGAPMAGAVQYAMDAPLPSGRSREEIAAQAAYDKAHQTNEEAGSPGYVSQMGEEMMRSATNMATINRENQLKAALLAALLGGVGSAGTGALVGRIAAAAR